MDKIKELEALKTTKPAKKWDHKTVPHLIQFITVGNNNADHSLLERSDYIKPFNVILTSRKYRGDVSDEDAIKIVRRERDLPETTKIFILFNDHPKYFISYVFDAWRNAYKAKKPSRLKEVDAVLQLIERFDPRRGETWQEHVDRWH